jgi:GNAT superfamily N-acetyltransferase
MMRPATMDDLATAVDLFNICSQTQIGADEFTVEEYRTEWESPGFDLEKSTRAVLTPDGQLIGLIEVWDLANPPVKIWVWGRVHPDFEGLGIGTMLMEWAEERARQAITRVPDGVQVIMQTDVISTYEPAHHLFNKLDMEQNRHFWRMVIDLADDIPQPVWPKGITLRTFSDMNDLHAVYKAVDDAFQDHWGYTPREESEALERWQHYIETDEAFDPALWFLAMEGDEIAAISLCRSKITDDPEMGFVDTLGVCRPWRRQGLALALLHHSFTEFKRRGRKRAGLGVDAGSLTGATKLYEKAGMHVDRQYDNYAKVLRPGKDISTQNLAD